MFILGGVLHNSDVESTELKKLAAECRLQDQSIDRLNDRATVSNGKVQRLNLDGVNLAEFSHFPVTLFKFDQLKHLSIRQTGLTSLPEDLHRLRNLEYLDAGDNFISDISREILDLPNLKKLKLGNNPLMEFNNPINANLEFLDLSNSHLNMVPNEVFQQSQLKYLSLSGNRIGELNYDYLKLDNLEFLNLRDNELKSIPDEIYHLPKLKKLNLYCNPIRLNDRAVLQSSSDMKIIVDHRIKISWDLRKKIQQLEPRFFDYRDQHDHPPLFGISPGGKPLNSVLVFGEPGVGKQSLIESYLFDHFVPEANLIITQNRYLNWDHYIIQKRGYFYQLWYPNSQNLIYSSRNSNVLNGFYYANAIILVFDLTDVSTLKAVAEYIRTIVKTRIHLCPIIVVGNKVDLVSRSINRTQIEEILANIGRKINLDIPYIETSVTEGLNVQSVFDTLYQQYRAY